MNPQTYFKTFLHHHESTFCREGIQPGTGIVDGQEWLQHCWGCGHPSGLSVGLVLYWYPELHQGHRQGAEWGGMGQEDVKGDRQILCGLWDGCRASQGSAWGWKESRRAQRGCGWMQPCAA